MEKEVFEIVTEYLTNERLSRIMGEDEEYRAALTHEKEAYFKLDVTLSDEQKELINMLGVAQGEVAANVERITYQQGMKDMYALIMSLRDIADRRWLHGRKRFRTYNTSTNRESDNW